MEAVWSPHYRIVYMMEEYKQLARLGETELRGLVLAPTDSLDVWEGKLFIRTRKSIWVGYCLNFEVHFPDLYPIEPPVILITADIPNTPRVASDGTIVLPKEVLSEPFKHSVLIASMRFLINVFCSDHGTGYDAATLDEIAKGRQFQSEVVGAVPDRVQGILESVVATLRQAEGNVATWLDRAATDLRRRVEREVGHI
eukprot:PhM_4_TR11355/c0_g1_i1/m.1562